jgi:hypothetical protein
LRKILFQKLETLGKTVDFLVLVAFAFSITEGIWNKTWKGDYLAWRMN